MLDTVIVPRAWGESASSLGAGPATPTLAPEQRTYLAAKMDPVRVGLATLLLPRLALKELESHLRWTLSPSTYSPRIQRCVGSGSSRSPVTTRNHQSIQQCAQSTSSQRTIKLSQGIREVSDVCNERCKRLTLIQYFGGRFIGKTQQAFLV